MAPNAGEPCTSRCLCLCTASINHIDLTAARFSRRALREGAQGRSERGVIPFVCNTKCKGDVARRVQLYKFERMEATARVRGIAKLGQRKEEIMTQVMERMQEVKADKKVALTKIMVLTDFSEVSNLALQYALALARRYDARIYLTHVLSPDSYQLAEPGLAEMTYQRLRQGAEQGIADILISGRMRGVPHEVLLCEGSIWPTVEELIQKHEIDLVVTGTHGRGQMTKMLVGSVAEQIFRQAGCAVLTVGPRVKSEAPHEVELQNILFATDFGRGAQRAAEYAFSLAQEHGARLTVLHVIEEAAAYTLEGEKRLRELSVERMKKFMPPESDNWCKTEFRATFGEATEEILQQARETKAELIVMGAKARKNFAGHAPQAVAYNVMAKATCPVLTVRS